MATLFFDTSGLVKQYIAETGTTWVRSLNDPTAGHRRYIAQITGVEMDVSPTRSLWRR